MELAGILPHALRALTACLLFALISSSIREPG
jgi:hypothetical protein